MDTNDIYRKLNRAYFSEDCHEKEMVRGLTPLLSNIKVFVDVGASLGQFTRLASQNMTNGVIYAIEADPIRVQELKRNCKEWEKKSTNTIKVIAAAITDSEGEGEFKITNSPTSGGLFGHPTKDSVNWESVKVEYRTLDSLFADTEPDIVKIDVEGSELRVLRGAEKLLARETDTSWIIEIHSWADPERDYTVDDVAAHMKKFGYVPSHFCGKTLFKRNTWIDSIKYKAIAIVRYGVNVLKGQRR